MLGDKLNGWEGEKSPFETTLRHHELPVLTTFKNGPMSFVPNGVQFSHNSKVAMKYPKITAAGWHQVLTPYASLEPITGKRIAVLFSGGPAAGGHNVLTGLKKILGTNTLLGVRNGPKGLLNGDLFEITTEHITRIKNTGGFDFLGTDRTKIKTEDQLKKLKQVCKEHKLDAIVVIGGDDSNTNAAIMAEHLFNNVHDNTDGICVVGVPKTMDGDLQMQTLLPIPFGFSTATRVYSELVGNILKDAVSSKKYWHFIKLMGRDASHVALEVALQTRPTITLISEEVTAQHETLLSVINMIAGTIKERSTKGKNYGVVVIPEGLIEAIPEIKALIAEIDVVVARLHEQNLSERREFLGHYLHDPTLYTMLPLYIQEMLVADRDEHNNLKVAQIPTERMLADMVLTRLQSLHVSATIQLHSYGYEGRCAAPTPFDAILSYYLGMVAGSLVLDKRTGYLASITAFQDAGQAIGIPFTGLLKEGKEGFAIRKTIVDTSSPAFIYFAQHREQWSRDAFCSPGPIQYTKEHTRQQHIELPISVALNQKYKDIMFRIKE